MSLNYIDLFSGAGGMSLGFETAGFNNLFAIEVNEDFAQTYKKNFPDNNLLIKDIQDLEEDEIREHIQGQKVDVVIGGPPCQGFSLAGRNGRSFIEDERNYLFREFVRVVDIVEPRMFVMENVARMLSHDNGNTINEITSLFEEIGYSVRYKVLQASEYGVPQKRQRIFVVGTKDGKFSYPNKVKSVVTVKEAIEDLPKLNSGEISDIPNHVAMNHTQQMLHKMSYIEDGGDRTQIPEELRPKSGDSRKYIKYDSKKPSVTVTGDMRKIFHYSQNRALTARELARLQSFPDDFIFVGNSISIQQQIGNAVPPLLSKAVAEQVKLSLKKGVLV